MKELPKEKHLRSFIGKFLNNFSLRTTGIAKAQLLKDLKSPIDEVKLAKNGTIKLQSSRDFLREL